MLCVQASAVSPVPSAFFKRGRLSTRRVTSMLNEKGNAGRACCKFLVFADRRGNNPGYPPCWVR